MDLTKFCGSPDDERIGRPWSKGEFSLASNGHLLIRVPRQDGVEENTFAPDVSKGGVGWAFLQEPVRWVPCPEVSPMPPEVCPVCAGGGNVFVCPECDGAGEVPFETAFNDYGSFECLSCRGRSVVSTEVWSKMTGIDHRVPGEVCTRCKGKGVAFNDVSVQVDGALFSDRYLSWIGELPQAEIGVISTIGVCRFRFRGGDGLIMPRRS